MCGVNTAAVSESRITGIKLSVGYANVPSVVRAKRTDHGMNAPVVYIIAHSRNTRSGKGVT